MINDREKNRSYKQTEQATPVLKTYFYRYLLFSIFKYKDVIQKPDLAEDEKTIK